jgi:hypothetical protein
MRDSCGCLRVSKAGSFFFCGIHFVRDFRKRRAASAFPASQERKLQAAPRPSARVKEGKNHEHARNRSDRRGLPGVRLCLLRPLDRPNKWGIDPSAKTPAYTHEDGQDYVPTNGWTVFSHQFSSIAGAGPVTGAIQAAAFGWLPVLLWVLLGGIFFGAVTDFGALYVSVKNEGKSMGLLIEKYIGKLGRKLFLLFCWLFTLLVIAAFADMVAGTFNAYDKDGVDPAGRGPHERRRRRHLAHVRRLCDAVRPDPEKIPLLRLERGRGRPRRARPRPSPSA